MSSLTISNDVLIGIDLGGTRIRAGQFTQKLALTQRMETLTRDEDGLNAVIDRMVSQAQAVMPEDRRVSAIGVSVPGPVNPFTGITTTPPNLKGWHNVPLQRMLEDRLGAKVFIGNDANLAALAEVEMGAARGYKHAIYITISTGIGAGIVTDGRLLLGQHGFAAECGHIIIIADGDKVSTLEKEAAGPAIARQAAAAIEAGEQSMITSLTDGSLDMINAKIVGEAAGLGDKLARRLIERAGRIIGMGIVSLLHTFNPEIIVIGGGVAEGTWDMITPPMWESIKKYSIDSSYWEELKLERAQLGENVCLIGAGALALRKGI